MAPRLRRGYSVEASRGAAAAAMCKFSRDRRRYATALGKPVVTLHPPGISHMLKEVNATALAVCEEAEQVVAVLDYVITGALPAPRDADFKPMMERVGPGNPDP